VLSILGCLDGTACAFDASGATSIFWTGFSFAGVVAACSFTDAAEESIFAAAFVISRTASCAAGLAVFAASDLATGSVDAVGTNGTISSTGCTPGVGVTWLTGATGCTGSTGAAAFWHA
jgi:hypothetical protein